MKFTVLENSPHAFSHRGTNTVDIPENTVAAFAYVEELGYTFFETDVHTTQDGYLVAFHDDDLQRLTGKPGAIKDYPWAELQEIDLGGGHNIPLMETLLESFPNARFNIDPKSDEATEPLLQLIKNKKAQDRVSIGSFSSSRTKRIRQAFDSRICTSPARTEVALIFLAALLRLSFWKPKHGCIQIPTKKGAIPLTAPWFIKGAQKMGLQVHYWTINDKSEMQALLDAGADGIFTDNPIGLLEVLQEREETAA